MGTDDRDRRDEAVGATVRLPEAGSGVPRVTIGERELPALGRLSARYRPDKLLARGGMGEVRLCHDEHIGRQVAMKVMREDVGLGGEEIDRFLREARVQGQLEHPAIVPIHDLGVSPSGAPFFTMKRLRGSTLEEVLERLSKRDEATHKRFTRRKLLSAFVTVCEAIELAHARGVLHRDIKPANIMLGDYGEVYVLDWGLAKIADVDEYERASGAPGSSPGSGNQTMAGSVLGTPGYMAPEQLHGDVDALDGRTDVYALGAVLFEILAGRPLHKRNTPLPALATSMLSVDARASAAAPDGDIPPELDAICVRATAPERDERYASVREMIDAVEQYLDGDRDVALRRELASKLVESAAGSGDRAETISCLGRALALDPTHEEAGRALMELITAPPEKVPAEVDEAVERARCERSRFVAKMGIFVMLPVLASLPFIAWVGLRNVASAYAAVAIVVLVSINAYVGYRMNTTWWYRATLVPAVLLNAAFVALATRIAGPIVLVPAIATAMTMVTVLAPHSRAWLATAAGVLAIAVPYALEQLGVWSSSYIVEDGVLAIVPHFVELGSAKAVGLMTTLAVFVVLSAGIAATLVRRALEQTERRGQLLAWQMRQLVPARVRDARPAA